MEKLQSPIHKNLFFPEYTAMVLYSLFVYIIHEAPIIQFLSMAYHTTDIIAVLNSEEYQIK
jgi:hypothetical protein